MGTSTVAEMARFLPSGDGGLVVEFGDTIDRAISARVIRTAELIKAEALQGVRELVPTFRSLFVHYDPRETGFEALREAVGAMVLENVESGAMGTVWRIPVLYGGEEGPDLEAVAERTGLPVDEVIRIHTGTVYYVYMLGFLPGYGYMGEVPEELRLPRLVTPRVRLPAGSVAIAQAMTAIYPLESPGGWWLLGRTPVTFFDRHAERPTLLSPGDGVRFVPVPAEEYASIKAACESGRYEVEREEGTAA